jgi:hypothetical protein
MPTPSRRLRSLHSLVPLLLLAAIALPGLALASSGSDGDYPNADKYAGWVTQMKSSPKGPFKRIRWFCKDGSVLPPKAYACGTHGGGIQHGQWNDRIVAMRRDGYYVGNVIAELDPNAFVGAHPDLDQLSQILVERFLRAADDGWIFRGARSYRGALQAEDEEAKAREVMLAMLGDPSWRDPSRFFLVREAARLLPLQTDAVSSLEVRQLAVTIADKDKGFEKLRAKIHGFPDAGDAQRVREHAKRRGVAGLEADYAKLADDIDRMYAPHAAAALERLADATHTASFAKSMREGAKLLGPDASEFQRLKIASRAMAQLRDQFPDEKDPATALLLLTTSLELEREAYAAGNGLVSHLSGTTRHERLEWLGEGATGLYGAGFITTRHRAGVVDALKRVTKSNRVSVDEYREDLRYLARMPEWCSRWIQFNFSEATSRFSAIESKTHLFSQDRLRGSPLLFYGAVVDSLVRDANHEAGLQHELFGKRVGAGLRALNPGLVRGRLYEPAEGAAKASFDRGGIFLLPETVSDLPPVSGILTRGEGSSLSHVQLLARNLGIPNVVVGDEHLKAVRAHVGQRVVLAVSPNGVVQLDDDGPRWDAIFGRENAGQSLVIRPDLKKLDLSVTSFLPLSALRATDSGRLSGPKGANLGELKHYFGDQVPDGFVIPFGAFRKLLDQPIEAGGPSVFEWMKSRYAAIAKLKGKPQEQETVRKFLTRLRDWIMSADPGPEFRAELRRNLDEHFGKKQGYGVFVRSDTNVEDLPGFTGAGLNLTVFNVVGFDNIMKAIGEVWASPFTERAYGWRQDKMEQPEYVFPAVVIQLAFPSEKSGVMVTADVDTGSLDYATVAVNEGVGGAVDGQAAESLLISTKNGHVSFLAQATAPRRMALDAHGGIDHPRASGTDAVLKPGEIAQLVKFARGVSDRFPSLRDESGHPVAADVEFGFKDGRLHLLQMRPFVESKGAKSNRYLAALDAKLLAKGKKQIRLDQTPRD